VRVQHEHGPTAVGPLLRHTDNRIAVFHWERECPSHERSAHALKFGFGHPPFKDETLGATADGAIPRANAQFAWSRRSDCLVAQFGAPLGDIPECFRRHLSRLECRSCVCELSYIHKCWK
jgi:hypothetical protein